LIQRLNSWQRDPNPEPLSVVLDDPSFKEFVDVASLASLEEDPNYASDVVPLADGTALCFDLSAEEWKVVEPSAR